MQESGAQKHWGNTVFPHAAIVAYHMMLYTASELFRSRGQQDERHAVAGVFFAIASALIAAALPYAAKRLGKGAALVVAAVFALGVFGHSTGRESFFHNEAGLVAVALGYCLAGPVVYYLFFARPSLSRNGVDAHGRWFGLSLGIGVATKTALSWLSGHDGSDIGADERIAVFFTATLTLYLLTAALTLAGYFAGGLESFPESAPENETPRGGRNEFPLFRLACACVLFYMMNGLLSSRLFPMTGPDADPNIGPIPLLLVVLCPLVGVVLDWRDIWSARLVKACGFFFLLAPSLAVLDNSPQVYGVVHTLCAVGQFVLFASTTVLFAVMTRRNRWWCLVLCIPFVGRFISLPGVVMSELLVGGDEGIIVIVSILMAALFYHLTGTLGEEPAAAERGENSEAGETPAPENQHADVEALFAQHNLSAREREVAALLLRGMATADISAELHIAESTVKFHIKNIFRKFGVANRFAFAIRVADPAGLGAGEETKRNGDGTAQPQA